MTEPVQDDAGLARALLTDAFGRVHEMLPPHLAGLDAEQVLWRPDPAANSVGWMVWHLARVQDDHLAGVGGVEQAWTASGWAARFALPYRVGTVGYGHSAEEVAAFTVGDAELLL